MSKVVVVNELIDNLPFYEVLTWEKFQTFCTDVLYKRYNIVDSREYLSKGNKQHGIDIYGIKKGETKNAVAQCKLEEHLTPKKVLEVIDEFLKGDLVNEVSEFILCTSADLGRQRDEEETIKKARKKLAKYRIEFVVWDQRGLSKELRTNATHDLINIVYRYFDEAIAQGFFGNLWESYLKTIRKVAKRKYDIPLDYIERSVTSYSERLNDEKTIFQSLDKDSKKNTLIRQFEGTSENKGEKIILLSTAGFGKTEELKNLARFFSSDDKIVYPIKFSLRDYEGQSMEMLLSTYDVNWRNIGDEYMLLIFDGLDEIGEHHYDDFISHLNAFIEQHPTAKVVVSSRFNFYDIRNQQLRGFEIFILNQLGHYELQEYIRQKLGIRVDDFFNLIHVKKFNEYLVNPYYLTRLVRFFLSDQEDFPKHKTAFFDKILFERVEKDEIVHRIPEIKEKLFPIACRIAFCQTVSGKSTLTDEELKLIVPESETRKILNHFGIFNRNASTTGSWSFEHKNLQEYLCASVFEDCSFSEIQKIISFDFNQDKMQPRFLNTISFLFELVDKSQPLFNDLFSWINKNEPELLIRFEREQISKNKRNEIFYQLFESYKEKGITLRISSNFHIQELAAFVEVDETIIDFLSKELSPELPVPLAYDLLSILGLAKRPFTMRDKLSALLFSILKSKEYPDSIHAEAIRVFMQLGFLEKALFNEILANGVNLDDFEIRRACMFFLEFTDYIDVYVDFILKSIQIFNHELKKQRSIGSDLSLKRLISKFEAPAAIKKTLQYCISDKNIISRHSPHDDFHFELSELIDLMAKAVIAFNKDTSILRVVYRLFCGIKYISHSKEWYEPFKTFFEKTCGLNVIFRKFYKYDKQDHDLAVFADEEGCDFLLEEYNAERLSDQEMIRFRNILSHVNHDLFRKFYQKLIEKYSSKFAVDNFDVDYNRIWDKQKIRNQQMLLDRELFFEEADSIFATITGNEIKCDELWLVENEKLNIYQYSIVLEAIRDMCNHDKAKTVSIETFKKKHLDAKKWEGFVIETVESLIIDKNNANIDPKLIERISDWCIERINNIDFEKNIVDVNDSTFRYNPHIEYVKQVFFSLNLSLDDHQLLKMLASDFETFDGWKGERKTIGSIAIERVKDRLLLRKMVMRNIQNEKISIRVKCSHYRMCHTLNYRECLPLLYGSIVSNPLIKDFDRRKLTEIYLDLGGEIIDFAEFLVKPTAITTENTYASWHWFLIERLQYIEQDKVGHILLEILADSSQEVNHIKAIDHLIQMSRIEGLKYWAAYIMEKRTLPFDDRWEHLQQYIPKMPLEKACDIFLDTLKFVCDNDLFNPIEWAESIQGAVFNGLIIVAKQAQPYYMIIKEKIAGYIHTYAKTGFVDSLKYFSERLTQRYNESLVQDIDIQSANRLFDSVHSAIAK